MPADALDHHLEAPLGQQPAESSPTSCRRPYGERTSTVGWRGRRACAGHPAVGQQHRAVVHRGAQVARADHARVCARGSRIRRARISLTSVNRASGPAHGHRIAWSGSRPEIMPRMPKESRLTQTPGGKVPEGAGWFVLNAREARWLTGDFGAYTRFEGEERFPHLGINIGVLQPGQPACYYHGEEDQEDFLVLSRRVPAADRGPGAAAASLGLRPLPAVDRARLRRRRATGRARCSRSAVARGEATSSTRRRSWPSATVPASAGRPATRPRPTPTSPTTSRPPTGAGWLPEPSMSAGDDE